MSTRLEFFRPDDHYEEICQWWRAQDWPVIPLNHLPQIGFLIFSDEEPAAAGWIYQTDSAFCLFEWIVANPKVRRERRAEALEALIEAGKSAAKEMGFGVIFISARSQPLISRLKRHGFGSEDANMTNLIFSFQGVE